MLIVANTVGASGCKGPGSGTGGTFGTLVHPLEMLLWEKWEYFQENEIEILSWNPDYVPQVCIQWEGAKAECGAGRIWTAEFCYTNRRLMLLEKTGTKWKKIGEVQGKKGVQNCRGRYPFFMRLSPGKLGVSKTRGEHQFAIRPSERRQQKYWDKFIVKLS